MPSPSGTDPAVIVETYEGFVIDTHLGVAALAFLVYEYMITLEREVNSFWNSKLTSAVVLFLLNRYIVLVTSLLAVSGIVVDFTASSCGRMAKVTNAFAMLQYLPWAAFSAIRVYALSSSSACMLLIFVLSIAPAGAALVHLALGLTGEMDPIYGCIVFDPTTPDIAHKLTIGSRTCLILADALIILITWRTIPRRSWKHGHASTFASILVWNGTFYFVIMLVLNLLHLVFTAVSISAPFQAASYVILFIHPITGILVSRFLFDLQDANRQALHLDSNSPLQFSAYTSDGSLSFARVIGSLGTSIPSASPYDDDEDLDNASQRTEEYTNSPAPSLVIHITHEITTEPGYTKVSTLGSLSGPPAYDEGEAGVRSLHARKVTFDDKVVGCGDLL